MVIRVPLGPPGLFRIPKDAKGVPRIMRWTRRSRGEDNDEFEEADDSGDGDD